MSAATAFETQAKIRFDHADVLLFDPVFANRTTLRTSLEMLGFRRITVVSDNREIPELVHHHVFDLYVADVTEHAEKACARIRAMREGRACANPFVHIVLMAWKLDNDVVRRALSCGADEFVTRPFSVAFLGARIKASMESRANFVVTGDYVGPDRRRDQLRRTDVPAFVAPNSMQIKCSANYDPIHTPAAIAREIKAASAKVGEDRVRRSSVQLPLLVRLLKEAFTDMGPLEPGLARLQSIARDTLERAQHAGAQALLAIADPLVKEIAGAQSGEHVAAHIDAVERLAAELYLAANPGCTLENLAQEIEQAHAAMKGRGKRP